MAEATETLDLKPVLALLERWRRIAWSSADPMARQRMLRNAGAVWALQRRPRKTEAPGVDRLGRSGW
jgi:hypothetical protein